MQKKIYNTTSEKRGDFIIGFVLGLVINSAGIGANIFMLGFLNSYFATSNIGILFMPMIIVVIFMGVLSYFIGRRRKYTGSGILVGTLIMIVVFLLLIGSCLLLIKAITGQ
ncbi:MAG: hypothetical protein WCY23_01580 [Candidatus Omnitrophota bacterium]